jgi:hypothetical protein
VKLHSVRRKLTNGCEIGAGAGGRRRYEGENWEILTEARTGRNNSTFFLLLFLLTESIQFAIWNRRKDDSNR